MKVAEMFLSEMEVLSSWIDEIDNVGKDIIMTLLDGRKYIIHDVPDGVYDEWILAPSKGKFWHSDIRDYFLIRRTF